MLPVIALKAVGGILSGCGYAIWHQRRTIKELHEDNEMMKDTISFAQYQMYYLLTVLDNNGVELEEFDMIALTNPALLKVTEESP